MVFLLVGFLAMTGNTSSDAISPVPAVADAAPNTSQPGPAVALRTIAGAGDVDRVPATRTTSAVPSRQQVRSLHAVAAVPVPPATRTPPAASNSPASNGPASTSPADGRTGAAGSTSSITAAPTPSSSVSRAPTPTRARDSAVATPAVATPARSTPAVATPAVAIPARSTRGATTPAPTTRVATTPAPTHPVKPAGVATLAPVPASSAAPRPAPVPRAAANDAVPTTIVNFDSSGNQVQKFDVEGNAVDAHDGDLQEFNGVYYLYGTSYDCGYQLSVSSSQFCGFKSYSSTDLVNWTDDGLLFDANAYPDVWQVRCVQGKYGCYRPHVLYNQTTGLYVLWINTYDNATGYRVFTSSSPTSGFVEVGPVSAPGADPENIPGSGYVNGDFDLFVDDDGTAYIAYTTRLKPLAGYPSHTIDIMALNALFTDGVGPVIVADALGNVEAPSLTKRDGTYYLVYGPACAYCSGRETDYQATTDITAWDGVRHQLNPNSCGGQPSFVARIGDQYVYGSDLWQPYAVAGAVNANQALAQYFWTPLTFSGGVIEPFSCAQQVTVDTVTGGTTDPTTYRNMCDITSNTGRGQVFTAQTTGTLTSVSINTFGSKANGAISAQLYAAVNGVPSGPLLGQSQAVRWGWSSRVWVLGAYQAVVKGLQYAIVLSTSDTTSGCYGWDVSDANPYPGGTEISRSNGGWTTEPARDLRFSVTIT